MAFVKDLISLHRGSFVALQMTPSHSCFTRTGGLGHTPPADGNLAFWTEPRHTNSMKPCIAIIPIALCLIGSIPGYSATVASGTITDPAEDAVQDDLVTASITIDNLANFTFDVHFRNSTFVAGSSTVALMLDLDRNPATGYQGTDSAHTDNALIGADAQLDLPYSMGAFAKVYRITGPEYSDYHLQPINYGFTTLSDGYSVTLPLSALGATDSRMNFKLNSVRALSPNTTTPIQDRMTDLGSPVGTVTSTPEPSPTLILLSGAAICLRRPSLRKPGTPA